MKRDVITATPSASIRYKRVHPPGSSRRSLALHAALASLLCGLPVAPAWANESPWRVGAYVGKYYDTEPAGFTQGQARFVEHYLGAVTANKTLWTSQTLPLALEVDAMVGLQSGLATLGEVAVAPVLRWSGFPWSNRFPTHLRLAPLGVSYTTEVGPLERSPSGQGSRSLNWLFIELAFSKTDNKSQEMFFRLHHRCAIYDLLNNYGANGEDFFAVGFRRNF